MKGSIQVLRLFGIPVRVHWTFSLLFAYVIFSGLQQGLDWNDIGLFGLFILATFLCVLLHEYGHALAARWFGVKTHDITLLPVGGFARLEKLPEKPVEEMVVALAGPVVNLSIWLFLTFFMAWYWDIRISLLEAFVTDTDHLNDFLVTQKQRFVFFILQTNAVLLFAFNMLPAFPMDGGRIFRALLSMKIGRVRATKIASVLGQVFAVGFLLVGFWKNNYMLAIFGFTFYFIARNERRNVLLDDLLDNFMVKDVMQRDFKLLNINDLMETAIAHWQNDAASGYLVVEEDEHEGQILRGVLSDESISDCYYDKKSSVRVAAYLEENYNVLKPEENLKHVYQFMKKNNEWILPVQENDDLIGVVDWHLVEQFVDLQRELKKNA
ncbi:MAG: hypothetical protein RL757_943 [Bacteroidota bacterium]|jgi:Zn-dependent protease/predicted transcriptional regulator